MKIKVLERKFKTEHGYSRSYQIIDCIYCCDGIKKLPNVDFYFETTENTDNNIDNGCGNGQNLGIMLKNDVTYYDPYEYNDYGYSEDYFYKFNYCPICGEKIDVEIIDSIDITDEYNLLIERKKYLQNMTDDTEKCLPLRKKIVDNDIKKLYITDHLKKDKRNVHNY